MCWFETVTRYSDSDAFRKPLSTIINPGLYVKEQWNSNNNWDIDKIRRTFDYHNDVKNILKTYIPQSNLEDKCISPCSKSSKASTKPTYRIIMKAQPKQNSSSNLVNWKSF